MSKLTLTVDPDVIRQAKSYAASQQQSLSKLVENYLKTLPKAPETEEPALELKGLVADLAGVIDESELAKHHADYVRFLQEKYQ